MTTRRTSAPATVSRAPGGVPAATAGTAEERFARHLRGRHRGPGWHYELGRLALQCCPRRVPHRTRRLRALAATNAPCSPTLLYRATKFAEQFRPAGVRRLEQAGVGWEQVSLLLPLGPADRRAALARLNRGRMTVRELRLWRDERCGPRLVRGGRTPAAVEADSPPVLVRRLACDCRRLLHHYPHLAGMLEEVLRAVEAGTVPPAGDLAEYRQAVRAVGAVIAPLAAVYESLVRIGEEAERADEDFTPMGPPHAGTMR